MREWPRCRSSPSRGLPAPEPSLSSATGHLRYLFSLPWLVNANAKTPARYRQQSMVVVSDDPDARARPRSCTWPGCWRASAPPPLHCELHKPRRKDQARGQNSVGGAGDSRHQWRLCGTWRQGPGPHPGTSAAAPPRSSWLSALMYCRRASSSPSRHRHHDQWGDRSGLSGGKQTPAPARKAQSTLLVAKSCPPTLYSRRLCGTMMTYQ